MHEPRWLTTTGPTTCLACRRPIPVGSRAYSLTGFDRDAYCAKHGTRAEAAMEQNRRIRERDAAIIGGRIGGDADMSRS